MQKEDGQIAHRTILPISQHQELLRNSAIRHAQAATDPLPQWCGPIRGK